MYFWLGLLLYGVVAAGVAGYCHVNLFDDDFSYIELSVFIGVFWVLALIIMPPYFLGKKIAKSATDKNEKGSSSNG